MTQPARTSSDTRSLGDLLANFVAESEDSFPALKGGLILYDVRRNTYYASDAFNAAAAGFKSVAKFNAYLGRHSVAKSAREAGDKIAAYATIDTKHDLYLIMFNEKVQRREMTKLTQERQQILMSTLDHELAHLAIPDGFSPLVNNPHVDLLQENVAEAYAQLMQYKRYGAKGELHSSVAMDVARTFVFNDSEIRTHLHLPTVREIVARKDAIDFDKATVPQLATLARRFALRFTPSDAVVRDLDEAFAPCRKAYKRGGIAAGMRALAALLEKTTEPHVAQLGADVFLAVTADTSFGLTGPEWQGLRRRIKTLDFKLAQQDILYGAPQRTAPGTVPRLPKPRHK